MTLTKEDITLNLRYPGQYYDSESNLHYNYFRYYDPELGRYITPDPIGLSGGVNRYLYVGGNPIGFVDENGLWIVPAIGAGVVVGIVDVSLNGGGINTVLADTAITVLSVGVATTGGPGLLLGIISEIAGIGVNIISAFNAVAPSPEIATCENK